MRGLLLSLIIASVLSGCSSAPVSHSNRKGLFDQLELGEGSHRARARGTKKELDEIEENPEAIEDLAGRLSEWHWPLQNVEVTSHFGERGNQIHEGVDLQASVGTPVYSTADGVVAYSGSKLKGYGRMVVVEHDKGIYSLYAHLSKSFVSKGSEVRRGQRIAVSGRSGKVTGPHLHFEIRRGVVAYDPVKILTKDRIARPVEGQSRKLATSRKKK